MAIFNLYSKRQKYLRGDIPDVYSYDHISEELKVQIVHIWFDSIGNQNDYDRRQSVHNAYKLIVDTLCREYGIFKLSTGNKIGERDYISELANYFIKESEIDKVIDIIELSFRLIDNLTRDYQYKGLPESSEIADDAIEELNNRFKEHGVGYQFIESEIIRIDSDLIHSEVVKPVLKLLNDKKYLGAQEEFLNAYDHYRHGKHKEAINDCLKSFESTMKAICEKQKWSYQQGDTAKTLIQICFDNGLIPQFWQQQLGSLRSLLESSIPTGRNKLSGHGQGSSPTSVPDYLVSYMLHMTASTLVFLTSAEKDL